MHYTDTNQPPTQHIDYPSIDSNGLYRHDLHAMTIAFNTFRSIYKKGGDLRNGWFPALKLEPSILSNYRSQNIGTYNQEAMACDHLIRLLHSQPHKTNLKNVLFPPPCFAPTPFSRKSETTP
jgi:hypothetical protein